MSSVWTGMACEAGREERGPKMREPSRLDLHLSNLEEERKRYERQEGGFTMFAAAVEEKGYSPQLCY